MSRRVSVLSALCRVAMLVGASAIALVTPGSACASLGVEKFESSITASEGGEPAVQAGSHPYALTVSMVFDHHSIEEFGEKRFVPDEDPKAVEVNLPVGIVVNPDATTVKCTEAELEHEADCPNGSAVGLVTANTKPFPELHAALFNMVPPAGQPAELGFNAAGVGVVVHIVGRVRTGGDYGLSAEVSDITQKFSLYGAKITLWGNPTDPSHNRERGRCVSSSEPTVREIEEGIAVEIEPGVFICPVARAGRPLLTSPSGCTGPLVATMRVDSWQEPDQWTPALDLPPLESSPAMPAIGGCGSLDFSPRLAVAPGPSPIAADVPSGLSVSLAIPQEENFGGLAEADLKSAVVTLPPGMSVSPAAAAGLGACTPQQIGLNNAESPDCPEASKLGSLEIVTPLLEHSLEGSVYLAQQGNNPYGSLIAVYLVAEGSGVVVKLPGRVELGGEEGAGGGLQPGQVRATFGEDPVTGQFLPQLPFSEVKMSFFGGPRGALATPSQCGAYTATSQLTPYSSSTPATPASEFAIGSGCGGGFDPSFTTGTSNNQADGFSPFSVVFSRKDDEQDLAGITVHMPAGLLGKIANVQQCAEPQAQSGSCPESSKIGNVSVAAGAGPEPYWITGGRAYLTGPYGGAPYGLSIVVPTEAGPFNLGPEVVRAAIFVDPHTAALTIVSSPLPTIKDGVPFQIKEVVVDADREDFVFNPTTCEALRVEATISGTPPIGSSEAPRSATVSSPFAVAGCRNLPFKPSLSASTQAQASRLNGTSLIVKVAQRPGEANIRKVDLQLPTVLPARLPTLQKACPEAQFNADPAGCPVGSVIGMATAITPVLSVPLTGPAYLVSHGGAAYPDVVFLLQGQGVTIELTGGTQIKKNITYSKFETVPDAPITSFETRLPEGPHSALTSNLPAKAHESFCGRNLTMPTTITAQNGAQVTQSTKVAVTGCTERKAKRRGHETKRRERKSRGKHEAKQLKHR